MSTSPVDPSSIDPSASDAMRAAAASDVSLIEVGPAEHAIPKQAIAGMVQSAAHFLPSQGPIEVFVHHNTLHAFEGQSFHDAVKQGHRWFGGEPYLAESVYRAHYRQGRITDNDLRIALREELGSRGEEPVCGLVSRLEFRFAMLQHALPEGPDAELRWVLSESDFLSRFRGSLSAESRQQMIQATKQWWQTRQQECVSFAGGEPATQDAMEAWLDQVGRPRARWSEGKWEAFTLARLWRSCSAGITRHRAPGADSVGELMQGRVRLRDSLLRATGEDIDRPVEEFLIRFCGAYVDQGYSDALLPFRDQGMLAAFQQMYGTKVPRFERWLRPLPKILGSIEGLAAAAEASIAESLRDLGIMVDVAGAFVTETLLALGGWAGMIWQLESGVDWVVHKLPSGSLVDFLAVRLILERLAIRELARERGIAEAKQLDVPTHVLVRRIIAAGGPRDCSDDRGDSFQLYQVAQLLGWTPEVLDQITAEDWQTLRGEIREFGSWARRRVFHEAYEHHYRHAALTAFAQHAERRGVAGHEGRKPPSFQIVTCIDDREESFRRHLEEVAPSCETFGAAGFFAVAMYYRGAADAFYKPLCPGVITPDHYVQEDVGYSFEGVNRNRAQLRRRLGQMGYAFTMRSRTLVGGMVAGVAGSLATAPLIARVLFPRLTSQIRSRFGRLLQPPPVTTLQLERYRETPGPDNGHVGYDVEEMAAVVVRLLEDIGLTEHDRFSRIVMICGHGSSSLNNPHESAYCCGACAGKRGGPNARAFAQMANDWRVRQRVAARGIEIPESTIFIGAYHNTCDDSVVYYDLDRMPTSHHAEFEQTRDWIDEARRRNAHERCRRFGSADLNFSFEDALRHVEGRAQDISQARPEYNHATNALCVVGRRDWSRGLFLDRRAFLTSYDPTADDEQASVLARILAAAMPVCAGINLEYYFSCVDVAVYGAGSKLPHNLVSLLGVMEGTSSDLRTGLYRQMIEIHEPVRITFVVETTAAAMQTIMDGNPVIRRLVEGGWVHLALIDATSGDIQVYREGTFQPYQSGGETLSEVTSSLACYRGSRDHLPFASIRDSASMGQGKVPA